MAGAETLLFVNGSNEDGLVRHRLTDLRKWAQLGNTKGGCITVLFDWFGISCMTPDYFCFYLQNKLIQTCQTGGQWFSDTSPFNIPWLNELEHVTLIERVGSIWLTLCNIAID